MEAKKEQVAVWVTEKVHKGFNTVTKYVANDGKKFDDGNACINYERELDAIEKGKDLFGEFPNLTPDQKKDIICLCFGGYDPSEIKIVTWVCSIETFDRASDWLKAKDFNDLKESDVKKCIVGEKYLIASYTSGEHSDYPDYYGKIILFSDAIGAIDSLKNTLIQTTYARTY